LIEIKESPRRDWFLKTGTPWRIVMKSLSAFGLALAIGVALSAQAATPQIQTGRELVASCKVFAKLEENTASNAARPHRCHQFLVGFFAAHIESEKARREALISTLHAGQPATCIRLPEFLSYRDMAARVVAEGERDPALLDGPAASLAQRTLDHDFPCPPPEEPAPP
jgi:hypothetical protein